jgi:hypothetical protein
MSAREQGPNKELRAFIYKFPSEILRMVEEEHGQAAMMKTKVYEFRKRFRDGPQCDLDVL